MRNALAIAALLLAAALGALVTWHFSQREKPLPDGPALILKVREVARLETLDVTLYKKVSFTQDPKEESGFAALAAWVKDSVNPPHGKAIVFGVAHLSLDLRKLDERALRVSGRQVLVVLPRPQTRIELLPAQTEIIGSNLNSAQTAQLFDAAKNAFEGEVQADKALQERARDSARQTLRSLFTGLGFTDVQFVEALPPEPKHG